MKLAVLAVAIGAVAAGTAMASGWHYFPQPPPQYRGDVTVIVRYVGRERIEKLCDGSPKIRLTDRLFGCARGPMLILPNPCTSPRPGYDSELACHEIGHVNGWRH